MIVSPEQLATAATQLDLALTETQCVQLARYAELLQKWNSVHNLTAIDAPEQVLTHHLLDSLAIVRPVRALLAGRSDVQLLDVGSGGGLPGIPLAIALPELQVTLIDKVQKKVAFLMQAKLELQLRNLKPLHGRVEQQRSLDPFPLIVSRAFASLLDFVSLTRPLLAEGGAWLAMKGVVPEDEIRALPPWVQVHAVLPLEVPDLHAHRHLLELRPAGLLSSQR